MIKASILLRPCTVPPMSDADAARELRREIEAAGGEIYLAGAELRDHFERTRLTVKAKGEIGAALRATRISSDPPLTTVQAAMKSGCRYLGGRARRQRNPPSQARAPPKRSVTPRPAHSSSAASPQ